jgi:UPF0716 protein FxsA
MRPLLIVLAVVAVAEIVVMVLVGELVGAWPVIAMLVAGGLLGSAVVRWRLRHLQRGLMLKQGDPAAAMRQITDDAVPLVGGVLLMIPGFLTDVAGLVCLVPFTRALPRGLVARYALRQVESMLGRSGDLFTMPGDVPGGAAGDQPSGPVVRGEVLHDDDEPGRRDP